MLNQFRFLLLLPLLFLFVGCASDAEASSSDTIFGRLSEQFQFGSTEETILHKKENGRYFVSMDGEVLQDIPGKFSLSITDRETGEPVPDLPVQLTLNLCTRPDEFADPICDHDSKTLAFTHEADGRYSSESFQWTELEDSWWRGDLSIDPESEEYELIDFPLGIYPSRPPSTNTFELISIAFPYIVIGLFIGGFTLRKSKLVHAPQG